MQAIRTVWLYISFFRDFSQRFLNSWNVWLSWQRAIVLGRDDLMTRSLLELGKKETTRSWLPFPYTRVRMLLVVLKRRIDNELIIYFSCSFLNFPVPILIFFKFNYLPIFNYFRSNEVALRLTACVHVCTSVEREREILSACLCVRCGARGLSQRKMRFEMQLRATVEQCGCSA